MRYRLPLLFLAASLILLAYTVATAEDRPPHPVPPVVSVEPTLRPSETRTLAEELGIRYRSCEEARDAGDFPLKRGRDAGYRRALDGDGDGLACEETP